MRMRFLLLLCLGGNLSGATLHPTVTYATASDVAKEPLSNGVKVFSPHRWSNVMMSNAEAPFFIREPVFRPERQQGETPPDFSTDFDEAVQAFANIQLPVGIVGFEGLGAGFTLSGANAFQVVAQAPDTSGAAGFDQFVQIVNQSLEVFKKDGTPLLGPIDSGEIWRDFDGECGKASGVDAVVLFDHLDGRWLVTSTIRTVDNDAFQCVAVSRTSDATGIYARYEFPFGQLTNDYGKFAVWPDAYYATYDLFDGRTFKNTRVCAYERAKMLAGTTMPAQQCVDVPSNYAHLLPSDLDGSPPSGATPPNFIVNIEAKTVNIWRYTIDWHVPTVSAFNGPTAIAVKKYQWGCLQCIPEQGSPTTKLTPIGDRPMFRSSYRSRSGAESLLLDHTVQVLKGSQALTGIRWYEISNPSTIPTVAQQSTYAPDMSSRWMPSMAMDKMGNIAIGYSKSSATSFPSMFVAGRTIDQTASTLSGELQVKLSTTFKPANDWGDYSHMSLDPTDDCTFWYTSEYLGSHYNDWHTYIAHFKFNGCS